MKIRIGSRESRLAVIQSTMVMDAIKRAHPEIELELVTMKTTGDKILDRTLDKVGGKGLFVKELDRALLDGEVDLNVHSMKDMPMETDPRLPIVAVSRREDPRDALLLPSGAEELDLSKPIGCASARRKIQLEQLFPGCRVEPVRGNVLTRLEKLDQGGYAALVLACAGLRRLGLGGRISRIFEPEELLPAACQGILAVQTREGLDPWFLDDFRCEETALMARVERAFVRALDGGCSSPVAAYARMADDEVELTGLFAREDGTHMRRRTRRFRPEEAEQMAAVLAWEMREADGQ